LQERSLHKIIYTLPTEDPDFENRAIPLINELYFLHQKFQEYSNKAEPLFQWWDKNFTDCLKYNAGLDCKEKLTE